MKVRSMTFVRIYLAADIVLYFSLVIARLWRHQPGLAVASLFGAALAGYGLYSAWEAE